MERASGTRAAMLLRHYLAQPIKKKAPLWVLPLSPRGCSPEGVASAKGWARGSVSRTVGASQALASVSA